MLLNFKYTVLTSLTTLTIYWLISSQLPTSELLMIHFCWISATIASYCSVLFPCIFSSNNDIHAFRVVLVSESSSLLFQGKAEGRRTALWFRARLQSQLFQLGCFLHRHAGKVLFVAVLVLSTFCVGLKSAVIHSRAEQLWVEGESPFIRRSLLSVSYFVGSIFWPPRY